MSPLDTAIWPAVSVVMPVLNEERHLREAVTGILAQDYPGELEVVLAIGPSRDRTDEVAQELAAADARVRVVDNPDGHTPHGLNAAIAAAKHDVLVRVDGHSVLPAGYVRTAVEVLDETGSDNVGGLMAAEGSTDFERAVACAMSSRIGVGATAFHTGGAEGPAETVYLGAFRRSALDRVGGYDETFHRAQDWEMNHRIRETGGVVWFTPRLRVEYRPRSTFGALARQYFTTGAWRWQVMVRHPETVSARYLAPPAAVAGTVAALAVALTGRRWALVVPGAYVAAVVVGAAVTGRALPPRAKALLPAVYATMHHAWGAGFLTGVAASLRRRVRD
ncbi:MAG: glycosyltransferase family 2 protein [Streptosporangiales bacterium]|nr:glycosyltransferase family 2 protein [Streptosporangiales bacterium]